MQLYNNYVLINTMKCIKVTREDKYKYSIKSNRVEIQRYIRTLKTSPEPERSSALPNSLLDIIYSTTLQLSNPNPTGVEPSSDEI